MKSKSGNMAVTDQNNATNGTAIEPQKFSDYEKVYLQMSRAFKQLGKEHWSIHCICSIKPGPGIPNNEITARLRTAWKLLAKEYPGLVVRPVGLEKQYDPNAGPNLEGWTAETFFEDNQSLEADSVLANVGPRELPALYYLPRASEVILLSQHWRTDGLGCCMLLDRLFELFATTPSPSNTTTTNNITPTLSLSPSLETAAGSDTSSDATLKALAARRIDEFHAKAVQAGGLPFTGAPTTPPGVSTHADHHFSPSETQALVQACRAAGISVSAALHAALAQTYFSFAESEAEKQAGYTTIMAANMRPFLPPPFNGRAHACQTYVASITPTVEFGVGFVEAARALTEEYRGWCTPELRKSLYWLYRLNIEKLAAAAAAAPKQQQEGGEVKPVKPPSGVTLSSLGVVERSLKGVYGDALEVEEFRFGVSMMTRQTLLYAWTFRGRLTISLDYNEAYYSPEMAREVVERVRKNLYQGLGI